MIKNLNKSAKQLLTIILLSLLVTYSFATIRTVSNHNPNPGQYTTIQNAINASASGDTIYVHPSPNNYAGFTLDRRLVIIGGGFEPSSLNTIVYTNIDGSSTIINNINASFSTITGIRFTNVPINFTASGIHDISINRCYFNLTLITFMTNMYNVTVSENVFYESGVAMNQFSGPGSANNFLITNNVFRHSYFCCGAKFSFDNFNGVANTTIVNNLFYSGGGGGGDNRIANNSSGLAFSNNIFNRINFSGLSGSTFSNCLTYNCSSNTPWIDNGSDLGNPSNGTQNIANTSPLFINQTGIDGGGYGGVGWFEVSAGSPVLSSMPGDPDMGPYYGDSYDFRNASASTLPFIYSISISNPNIQAGTNLNISVTGKKHN